MKNMASDSPWSSYCSVTFKDSLQKFHFAKNWNVNKNEKLAAAA